MKYLKLKFLLMFFALAMAIPPAWAETSTMEFTKKCGGSGTADDGAVWMVTSDGTESNFDDVRGIHYGTNSAAVTYLQLSTSDIEGTITKVEVTACDATSSGNLTVTVGASDFYCSGNTSVTLPAASGTYSFTGSGNGEIVVRIDRGSSMKKAIYLLKIVVTYETGGETPTTVATPTFSLTPATYATAQSVEITCATEGATIYYTTDGTTPTDESDEYTGAISITESTTLKAIAILGEIESDVATAFYGIATEPDPIISTYFQKVTSAEQIGYGRKYIVVFEGAENDDPAVLGAISTTSTRYGIPVTGIVINNAIVDIQDKAAQVLTLRGDATNGWSFQNTDDKYLTWLSGNSLNVQDNITDNAKWTFPNANSHYVLTNQADPTRILQYNANSGSERFACYTGSQKDAVLYVQIPEPEPSPDPSITVNPTSLSIGEDGGSFTVEGRNLIDNIGVTPSNGFTTIPDPKPSEDESWGFVNNNGSVDGTVTVNYTGNALNAEGTVTMGTKISWDPEQDTNATVTVNYLYDGDIYILGNYGNDWNYNDASHKMENNNGIYTTTFEVPANSYVVFARKLNDYGLWDDGHSYFGAPSNDYPVNQDEVSGNLDVNHPYVFKIENAGEYTFTVNANNETFNIKKTVDPSTLVTYVKVTSANQIVAGKKYIFVQEASQDVSSPQAMGAIGSDYFGTGIPVTISDNKVVAPAEVLVFTLSGSSGNYKFKDKDGKYLRGANGTALSLGSDADNAAWSLNNNNNALSGYRARNAQYDSRSIKWHLTSNRFGHYGNDDVNSSFTFIYVEDDGTTPVVQTVETPVINPGTGTYTEAQTVTISCATEGAAISYKIGDGEYQPYTAPFEVSESCTIKAKATKDGWDPSEEASVTYTINLPTTVTTLAAAKALDDDAEFNFNGEVVVTFKQSYTASNGASHTLIGLRDNNATEGGGVFHNAKASIYSALEKGKVLNPGWTADKETHEGWIQFEDINGVTTAENDITVLPFDRTNTILTAANQSEYIILNNVTIAGTTATTAGGSKATYTLYDLFNNDETVIADGQYKSLVGVVGVNGETVYVYPLEMTPKDNLTLGFDPASVELYVGQRFTAPELTTDPEGVTVNVTYTSNNAEVATVTENVVSLVNGATGTATITATFDGDANYNPTTATYTINVKAKEAAGLSYGENPVTVDATYGDTEFTEPTLTNEADLTVTYSSDKPEVASVDPNTGEVTINGAGTATITASTDGDDIHNGGSASYTIVVAQADATVTFDPKAYTKYVNDESFTGAVPTIDPEGLEVTYTIEGNDPEIVLFDEEDGTVVIGEKTGTVTITATVGGEGTNYKQASDSYTLTIEAKPYVTVIPNSLDFEAVIGEEPVSKTFTVMGENLKGNVTLTLSETEVFTITPATITKAEAEEGATVTVTYNPKAATGEDFDEATITITSTDAENVTVTLTGMATLPDPVLTVSTETLEMGTEPTGTFTVTGQNLTEDVTVTVTGENASKFTVNPATITMAEAMTENGKTVTVTYTGNSTTDEYATITVKSGNASKDVIVTARVLPTPQIIAEPENLTMTAVVGQTPATATFTVMADDLRGDITLTMSETDVFTIEPATIAKADMTEDGVEVTVTYTPTQDGNDNATITIASEAAESITITLNGTATVPEVVAAPTFSLVAGSYTGPQTVTISCATESATILYSTDGGSTWTAGNTVNVDKDMTIMAKAEKDGYTNSATVTAAYIIDIPEELPTIEPFKGYYQIKNNENNKYANIAGRRTLTFTDAPADKAGTVIWLETNDKGQVQSIRSQAADLQGYANRAMRYVPQMVQLVADKLHAEGAGTGILGENGLDAIMDKFNECFDYHLYVEEAQGGWRLYGKTPSMQHVVDFYREHTVQVEEKLPMLEQFINDALTKLRNKVGGSSIFTPFSLHQIWDKMGRTLTEPNDAESTMAFYREVLNNKNYVWDFAYQTAQIYWNNVKDHPRYAELKAQLGEYADYIDEFVNQVRPDFKYYVIQRGDEPDYISEGNGEIINNDPRTIWTIEDRETFKLNSAGELFGCPLNDNAIGGYFTTNYTDFAYTLPEGVTAYKVTSVDEDGEAKLEALSGIIPAQTPVLLVADKDGAYEVTLTTDPATADTTGNLLVGPDYLIKLYQFKTPMVVDLFTFAQGILGVDLYNEYVKPYEYLQLRYAGTVNNKYFWNVNSDLGDITGINVLRSLSTQTGELAFSDQEKTENNKAFMVSETFDAITLPSLKRGDVNHDGVVNIQDVTDLIDRLLKIEGLACPYCSDVNSSGAVNIEDVTDLIDIYLLGKSSSQTQEPGTGE